jgi:hypothetical protein
MTAGTAGSDAVIYSRTQVGWWLLVTLGTVTALSLALFAGVSVGRQSLPPGDARIIAGVVLVVLVITAVVFSTLNVRIAGDTLAWRFGPGLVRFSLPLAQIASVAPGRSSWLAGIGIHWVGSGWVYNVSGRDAVEITKRDGGKLWIGTPEPAVLAAAIEQARNSAPSPSRSSR